MTEFCQTVSMPRPFRTLNSRVIPDSTLRNLSEKGGCSLWSRPQVSCMGLLKFSLFEAVKNQSYIKLEP